jgi:molybdopterin converting factor small subunit
LRVEVKYLGFLEELLGREREAFAAPEMTPRKILEFIIAKYGKEAQTMLFTDRGEVTGALVVLHEGRNVHLDESLADGMVITLVLPVAGG